MRWEGKRQSSNVEDVRGRSPWVGRGAGLGCGGIILVIVFSLITGQDPLQLLQSVQEGAPPTQGPSAAPGVAPQDEAGQFSSTVLANTEDVWTSIFAAAGKRYEAPKLVLFSEAVQSACGMSSAAVGPFYCPPDRRVYLDTGFFNELSQRFGAPGDFAAAYVVAHEVGHHVQNLLGIADQVQDAQRQAWNQSQSNSLSVRMELQADCLAGVWAHHADKEYQLIEAGDFEEGLRAAAAIGDDEIQSRTAGTVVPESFTHGSSEDRVRWLRQGLRSGDPNTCDTFGGGN
jgi:predicted metalloprotease